MDDEDIMMCPCCGNILSEDNRYCIDWQDYDVIEQFGQDAVIYLCSKCHQLVEPDLIPEYEYIMMRREREVSDDNPV